MRAVVVATAICLSIVGLSAAQDAKAALRVPTNIPPQALGPALKEFAQARNLQVLYFSQIAKDLRTGGATGDLTADEALTQLLGGTGLTYRYVDDKAVTILPMGTPLSQEEISVSPVMGDDPNGASSTGKEGKNSSSGGFRTAQVDQGKAAVAVSVNTDGLKNMENQLEEIVVTARKRAENVQDVPISMSVVGAEEISERGLINAEDYLRGMPGVNQIDSQLGSTVIIRGLEAVTQNQNFSTGAMVAHYFGETPTTSAAGSNGSSDVDIKLVDVDRVEVLRGPQGTAFGDSSMAGAIRVIPKQPKLDTYEGDATIDYSNTSGNGGNNYNIQAIGNIPLVTNRFAIRAAGYLYQNDGYYRNIAGSSPGFQAAAAPYGATPFAVDDNHVGSYTVYGGRISGLIQASEDLRLTLGFLSQKTETDGWPVETAGPYEQTTLEVAPAYVVRGQQEGVSDTHIQISNATMNYNLHWAELVATYSHITSGSLFVRPIYVNAWPISQKSNGDHREDVGEVRIVTHLDGAWNFLVGLYADNPRDVAQYNNLWYGNLAANPLAPGLQSLGNRYDDRTVMQKAAFGEVYWEPLAGLTLTGGVRGYLYARDFNVNAGGYYYSGGLLVNEHLNDSGAIEKANVSYKLDGETLLYANWSQGFRLAQLYAGLPSGVCDTNGDGLVDGTNISIASTQHTNPDSVESYEIGGKWTPLEHRVTIDADVFRMDWSGVPVSVLPHSSSAGCNAFTYTANGGSARSDGVELQSDVRITQALRATFGGSWIHARLTSDVPAQGFHAGDELPGSPKVSANLGLQYEFDVGSRRSFVRADAVYVGAFHGAIQQLPNNEAGDYVRTDLAAGTTLRENLNLEVYARNVTNESAFVYRALGFGGGVYGYRLQPRTIGLRVSFSPGSSRGAR